MRHTTQSLWNLIIALLIVTGTDPAQAAQRDIDGEDSSFDRRVKLEKQTTLNPFVITPHKPNYVLPFTYHDNPNTRPDSGQFPDDSIDTFKDYDELEMKFQFSFKVLIARGVIANHGTLHFGYTSQSYWQTYSPSLSRPFRETNHEPELMLSFLPHYRVGDLLVHGATFGLVHQSNGQSDPMSRSWNRLYTNLHIEYQNFYLSFKPWYRVREDKKSEASDESGDDNPDIERYMGHFELVGLYERDNETFGLTLRNNLRSDNRGAVQFDWTFPLKKRLRGYLQVFNGYGESLIDYNHSSTRVGMGIMLTNWL